MGTKKKKTKKSVKKKVSKKDKTPKNPPHRPEKPIDWDELIKLCEFQCTGDEIASFFKVDKRTLERRIKKEFDVTFAVFFKQYRKAGLVSLRRSQFKRATEDESDKMLIFLGKNYLNQKDKIETETTVKGSIGHVVKDLAKDPNNEALLLKLAEASIPAGRKDDEPTDTD